MPPQEKPGPPLFSLEAVHVRTDGIEILRGITATVPDGVITAVVGPSGAGKTTLLRLCNRLEAPASGTVRFRGRDVAELDPLLLRRRAGMVFQRPALFPGTVRDNLAVALPEGDDERYAAAMEAAALDPALLSRAADDLSGGEAQRACLARTLVTAPDVLLLDEPTSALDAAPTRVFEQVAMALAAHMPMVWVTHDLAQVRRIADHVVGLVSGTLAYEGPAGGLDAISDLRELRTEEA
jgi:putative ABC transport system ATP-binding protein